MMNYEEWKEKKMKEASDLILKGLAMIATINIMKNFNGFFDENPTLKKEKPED